MEVLQENEDLRKQILLQRQVIDSQQDLENRLALCHLIIEQTKIKLVDMNYWKQKALKMEQMIIVLRKRLYISHSGTFEDIFSALETDMSLASF